MSNNREYQPASSNAAYYSKRIPTVDRNTTLRGRRYFNTLKTLSLLFIDKKRHLWMRAYLVLNCQKYFKTKTKPFYHSISGQDKDREEASNNLKMKLTQTVPNWCKKKKNYLQLIYRYSHRNFYHKAHWLGKLRFLALASPSCLAIARYNATAKAKLHLPNTRCCSVLQGKWRMAWIGQPVATW